MTATTAASAASSLSSFFSLASNVSTFMRGRNPTANVTTVDTSKEKETTYHLPNITKAILCPMGTMICLGLIQERNMKLTIKDHQVTHCPYSIWRKFERHCTEDSRDDIMHLWPTIEKALKWYSAKDNENVKIIFQRAVNGLFHVFHAYDKTTNSKELVQDKIKAIIAEINKACTSGYEQARSKDLYYRRIRALWDKATLAEIGRCMGRKDDSKTAQDTPRNGLHPTISANNSSKPKDPKKNTRKEDASTVSKKSAAEPLASADEKAKKESLAAPAAAAPVADAVAAVLENASTPTATAAPAAAEKTNGKRKSKHDPKKTAAAAATPLAAAAAAAANVAAAEKNAAAASANGVAADAQVAPPVVPSVTSVEKFAHSEASEKTTHHSDEDIEFVSDPTSEIRVSEPANPVPYELAPLTVPNIQTISDVLTKRYAQFLKLTYDDMVSRYVKNIGDSKVN